MKTLHLISIVIFATSLLIGCSNQQPTSSQDQRHLTIATSDDPLSLDPRLVRDIPTITPMHMLFEGLMSTTDHRIIPAVAEKVSISDDLKTYTFTLRSVSWSDGSPLTAHDFEATWKSILSPSFPAPNAYQLYVIKGAKEVKEGMQPIDTVSIQATAPNTLVVELEQPTPYFLEMLSCHFFFPVHSSIREEVKKEDGVIGNGPFRYADWKRRSEFVVEKNPHYWAAENVKLDRISLHILDEHTALQLFKAGQLDWAGSPMSTLPQDAIIALKQQGMLQVLSGAGTHWFRFNTEKEPFDKEKIRRAFSLALDRQAIVDHVTQGNQQPAIGILPPSFGIINQDYYKDHDIVAAKQLFEEALKEAGISKQQLPKIVISYATNDRNNKIVQAVQQQWKNVFDIDIALEGGEGKIIIDKLRAGAYQTALGSWYADIQDPINFLEIFKYKSNPTNQTFWQNADYIALLDRSSTETMPEKRLQLLGKAEKLLIDAMPIAPLFYASFNYLKQPGIKEVYFSPLGHLNFREAEKE